MTNANAGEEASRAVQLRTRHLVTRQMKAVETTAPDNGTSTAPATVAAPKRNNADRQ